MINEYVAMKASFHICSVIKFEKDAYFYKTGYILHGEYANKYMYPASHEGIK